MIKLKENDIFMKKTPLIRGKIRVQTCRAVGKRLRHTRKEMSLAELRQIRKLSQYNLADVMKKKQPNLSKMERSKDMYVSTLCDYIRAMGGNLEIVACFPGKKVLLNQFEGTAGK